MKVSQIVCGLSILAVLSLATLFKWIAPGPVGQPALATSHSSRKVLQSQQPRGFESNTWQVTSVHDGDTIRVHRGSQVVKIRFACIDAPELKQPLGIASRDNLRSLIAQAGNQVQLQVVDTDRYGRKVAEVFAAGKLVQEEQARRGMVYTYRQYLHNCPDAQAVERAEAIARQQRAGVWRGSYQKPWDYRISQRVSR